MKSKPAKFISDNIPALYHCLCG